MKIDSCMKRNVVFISSNTKIGEAAVMMVRKHVGILPVVDENAKPIGVVHLSDLLSLELPDFINLVEDVDFVHDFGAVETTRPDHKILSQSVTRIMQPAEAIEENCGLLRALAIMIQNKLSDLPVIDGEGYLVGVVSRVDIGTTIISLWPIEGKK